MVLRLWAIALGLVLLLAPLGCDGRGSESKETNDRAQRIVPVTVAALEHRSVERTVDVVGSLKGWEEVTVGAKLPAMRVSRVARIHHDMGDRVKQGEMLVELEPIDADLGVQQAEKQLQSELAKLGLTELPTKDFDITKVPSVVQAEVNLEKARQNFVRERSLTQRGATTFQNFQNAENDEKGAAAALENAVVTIRSTLANALASKVALDVARQARIDMEIRAPIPSNPPAGAGKPIQYAVTKRVASEGQMLKQGDPVAELVVENPLRLWANVPERFGAEIQLDQPVRVVVGAYPDRVFDGKVARINPSVDPVSRTFQVEATVPNDERLLRPGGFARASILTKRNSQAVTVPHESVVNFAGVSKLFIVTGDVAKEVKVETSLEGHGWVEVIGSLPDQAQVVTTGQTQLADGTKVVIRSPETVSAPRIAVSGR